MNIAGGPRTISPTAHYTGYVWARSGLGPKALSTREGALLFYGLLPAMTISSALGGPALSGMLLGRHRVIDHLLDEAIADGAVTQVVEIAAGMSPRGATFTERFPELTYVETDLPGMVERKQHALPDRSPRHRIEALDVLDDEAVTALFATLDPAKGIAVVSEGLLNYLPADAVTALWTRLSQAGATLYLSDLHVKDENDGLLESAFMAGLGVFVRGRLHIHFADAAGARTALLAAGFGSAVLHRPDDFAEALPDVERPGSRNVRVVEARA